MTLLFFSAGNTAKNPLIFSLVNTQHTRLLQNSHTNCLIHPSITG